MKIGILTLPFEPNYGWAVQMWALYHTLEKLGHEPVVINRRWSSNNNGLIPRIKRFVFYNILCPRFKRFVDYEMHNQTPIVRDSKMTSVVTSDFDGFIVGSDQVWRIENTRLAGLDFFLDFLGKRDAKRLSYAASFGKDTWQGTPEETEKITTILKKFDAISVREDTGVKLCRDIFNANAVHVLDPTLLLDSSDYNSILSNPRSSDELITYILDSTREKTNLLTSIATQHHINLVNLYPKFVYSYYKSVYTWLEKIRDARYVVVDSFHGMVFSIVFEKQFVVLANANRGLTRFTSLLGLLGLDSRLTTSFNPYDINKILTTPIDYTPVRSKIQFARKSSMDFLKDALK